VTIRDQNRAERSTTGLSNIRATGDRKMLGVYWVADARRCSNWIRLEYAMSLSSPSRTCCDFRFWSTHKAKADVALTLANFG